MSYRPDNPFARPKEAPQEAPDPTASIPDWTGPRTGPGAIVNEMTRPTPAPVILPFYLPEDAPAVADHVSRYDGQVWTETRWPDLATAFSRPATTGLYAPNHPAYQRFLRARDRVVRMARSLPTRVATVTSSVDGTLVEHLDWRAPAAQEYLAALDDLEAAGAEAEAAVSYARHYSHPETGLDWETSLAQKVQGDRLAMAAAGVVQAEKEAAIASLALPSLDDFADQDWAIDGLLPDGGSALVIGAGGSGKSRLVADLAHAVAHDEVFAGFAPVMADEVVVIDTATPPAVLRQRYASALQMGARVLPFQARIEDLDVRNPVRRRWLASRLPARSIVIVDALPTILGVLDVAETSSDAGGYLAAWSALAAEADLAGLVIVHASPANDASRPRGHGSLASWPTMTWAVTAGKAGRSLSVTGAGQAHKLTLDGPEDGDSDPAKPGEEEAPADAPATLSPERQAVLETVEATPDQKTSQVAASLGVSIPTATRHLEALKALGLVSSSKKPGAGRSVFWSAN